ncbi:MAG: DUF1624 domain-containing protein [Brevundimonas sp.]|nr:MAG: DUF1624 domain-containing protein [Brevundimonas sp.]
MGQTRLLSLDVLRGITVMGMILVNATAGLASPQVEVFPLLLHARWDGLTIADTVFPGFLMMMGVAVPMALKGRTGLGGGTGGKIFWRAARLILIGFILSNLWWAMDPASSEWRLWGVLQRIGIVYGVCSILFLSLGPKLRLGLIAAILLLYWPLTLIPALDGLPNDIWERGHNFVASVDRVLTAPHNYVKGPEGYDPEGLLGHLPAIAHGLIGVAIGEFLLKRPETKSAGMLAVAGAAMLVAGIAFGFIFPVVKDIWSSSFVLVTCGITTLALAGLHATIDKPGVNPNAFWVAVPLSFGINAIAAYVWHELLAVMGMPAWGAMTAPYRWLEPVVGSPIAALVPVAIFIALVWAPMDYLRRKRWIIKV